MNRAMFSGVAGLKTHQIKMDVIGNNIANVNTYGYKAQRAVFSDMFYQTVQSASEGTITRGGTNPSGVGYGSSLAGIQTQMSTSSMQSTGFGMDVAITGEGFLQVMDADGNVFYTKAGLLSYDPNGYLTDINGYFVLGGTGSSATADSNKIKLDDVGSVDPARATTEFTLNDITYTITADNSDKVGNVGFAFGSSDSLPIGQDAVATISSTGSITVQLNSFATFDSMADLNMAINNAITEANGGDQHAAGNFTLATTSSVFTYDDGTGTGTMVTGLTGAQIVGTAGGVTPATLTGTDITSGSLFDGLVTISGTSSTFTSSGTVAAGGFNAVYNDEAWEITMSINGVDYTGTIAESDVSSSLLLKNDAGEYVEISIQNGYEGLTAKAKSNAGILTGADLDPNTTFAGNADEITVTPAYTSPNLGLGQTTYTLSGGTEGGLVTLAELTNIGIGSDGTVSVTHSEKGLIVVGKISLASFANPMGLLLNGSNYYSQTVNSGDPLLADPGSDGTGALVSSALEMSNVDLSEQFSEMITTQRGFQANSRIITVSDTMLEELINLKR